MKKILFVIVALSMLTIVSCKKAAAPTYGSWSFKSANYTVSSAIANSNIDNSLVAISTSNSGYGQLQFFFYSLPTAGGTFTVVNGAPDTTGTQIAIALTLTKGSTYSGPTYVPNAVGSATVTVGSNGLMKISMPAVDMINTADSTDHSALSATVTQSP